MFMTLYHGKPAHQFAKQKMRMRRWGRALQSDRHVLDAARSSDDFA